MVWGAALIAASALAWSLLSAAGRPPQAAPPPTASSESLAERTAGASVFSSAPVFTSVLSATDAAFADSTWFVLDRRGRRIHRFSQAGDLLGSFARRGEGPGELASPEAIAVHRDTVAVADRGTLHLYEPDGAHIADRRLVLEGCLSPLDMQVESSLPGLLVMAQCTSPARGQETMVFLANETRSARVLASLTSGERGRVLKFPFVPVISAHATGFVFGDPDLGCLDVYEIGASDLPATVADSVCHDWIPRLPLPQEDARAVREEMRGVAALTGTRLVVSASLPPFDRAFALADGRLAYRVPLPVADEDAGELFRLVVRGEADRERVLPFPAASAVFASGESVLAAWEALEGIRIAVFPLLDQP